MTNSAVLTKYPCNMTMAFSFASPLFLNDRNVGLMCDLLHTRYTTRCHWSCVCVNVTGCHSQVVYISPKTKQFRGIETVNKHSEL